MTLSLTKFVSKFATSRTGDSISRGLVKQELKQVVVDLDNWIYL